MIDVFLFNVSPNGWIIFKHDTTTTTSTWEKRTHETTTTEKKKKKTKKVSSFEKQHCAYFHGIRSGPWRCLARTQTIHNYSCAWFAFSRRSLSCGGWHFWPGRCVLCEKIPDNDAALNPMGKIEGKIGHAVQNDWESSRWEQIMHMYAHTHTHICVYKPNRHRVKCEYFNQIIILGIKRQWRHSKPMV